MTSAEPLFVAVDAGTTGARAVVVDLAGRRVGEVRRPYPTRVPHVGWAEQDPDDWVEHSLSALEGISARLKPRIAGIGLTGQCPTVAPVDDRGRPVAAGMLYRDNRATAEAQEMRRRVGASVLHRRTGHTPEAFHVGPKVLWLRRYDPDAFSRTRHFLQPRDLVAHRLTGRMVTDHTHANATLFFDLMARQWASDLLGAFGLDAGLFPPALAPWDTVASLPRSVASLVGLPAGIPVVVGGGDSQCAAFGAGVVSPGPISEMAGASSCLNSAVSKPVSDVRITHYSHVVPEWFTTEVGLNTTGAAIAWAVRNLGFDGYADFAAAATAGRRKDRGAPLFLCQLGGGERDDPSARGAFIGLTDRHERTALAYSVVEGVAMAVAARVELLERSGSPLEVLRVAGGGARLDILGQLKADVLGCPVIHLKEDTAAIGAAMLAANAVGTPDAATKAVNEVLSRGRWFEPAPGRHEKLLDRIEWNRRARRSSLARVAASA